MMNSVLPDLHGRVALITGARRGIGRAVAEELALLGADVILLGRDGQGLESVADDFRQQGFRAEVVVADLSRPGWQAELSPWTDDISLLVHAAAGFTHYGPLDQQSDEDIDRVIDVNLSAALKLAAALLPGMKKRAWGRMFFIGSSVASAGAANQVVYASAKSALSGLVKSLVLENAQYGINAHLLELGLIDTERTHEALGENAREAIAAASPAGRNGRPEEVARAIRYLLSADADFLKGVTLTLDGGLSLGLPALKGKSRN